MPVINAQLGDVKDEDLNYEGGGWRALPDGEYRVTIDESDYKQTSKGDGMRLGLKLVVVEPGPHNGAKLFDYLTLEHPSDTVVRIARAKLKQLAMAAGHPSPDFVRSSEELHNRVVIAKVLCEPSDNPKFGDAQGNQNKVVAYKPAGSANGSAQAQPPASSDEPPPPGDDDIPF